jgi:hypothetical protein
MVTSRAIRKWFSQLKIGSSMLMVGSWWMFMLNKPRIVQRAA